MEPVVDCDVLLEMYLVNRSSQNKYVREVRLSAEVGGVRTKFEMQPDFKALEVNREKNEYILEDSHDFYVETSLKRLLPKDGPLTLAPQEPTEGWVRFVAKTINPEKIDKTSWHVSVVDSLGTEHPTTKVATTKRKGTVGLRSSRG